MTSFKEAVRQHAPVQRVAERDPEMARLLWLATKGDGEHAVDSYSEAALDLAPPAYGSVLATGTFANAYAVECLWDAWHGRRDSFTGELLAILGSEATATAHGTRELARAAWQRFEERAKKAGDVQYGLGFDQSLSWECTREFDTSVARSMCTVEQIARLAGRMFAQLKRDKREQVSAAPEEIYDIELGRDPGRLLPSELIHLGEDTEVILLDALASGKALQYALRGSDDANKGPLVVCLDESGSMHNSRGVWSKAAAVALVRTAWEDDRTCAIVHWSDGVTVRILRPGDGRGLLDAIHHWLGGGNVCELALDKAADLVETLQKQGDRGADVILVTDGVEEMTGKHEAAIDRIEARSARLWTVGVECPIDEDVCIRARAEHYIHLDGGDVANGDIGSMKGAVI